MKKYIVFLLLGLVFSCKNENDERKTNFRIAFSQCNGVDPWTKAMLEDMKRELAFHPNVKFSYTDAFGHTQKQIEQIKQLTGEDIDLLIVYPNENEPLVPIIEAAYKKGISIVILDWESSSKSYTAYVGADNEEIGKTAGKYLTGLLKKKGKVFELLGMATSSPAIERHKGFVNEINHNSEIEIIGSVRGDWEKEKAKKEIEKKLDIFRKADAVFAQNDAMALAVDEVCKKYDISRPLVIGVDGLSGPNGGIQMVNDKIINATLLYPTGGEEAIRTAIKILEYKPFERENTLNTTIIDSSNVHILKMQGDKILSQQKDVERQQALLAEQMKIYKSQKTMLYTVSILLALALGFGIFLFFSLRTNRRINRKLSVQKEEIELQRNQIEKMAEKTRETSEAKFNFFTNISHEFRTPLTLILAPLDDMLSGVPNEFKHELNIIKKNALMLYRLVGQLLDFQKIENRKMKVQASEIDLISFIQDIFNTFEDTAKHHKIDFKFTKPDQLSGTWFDPVMLEKVLFNLISNAFKFTPDGGEIIIKIKEIKTHNKVEICIKDNGIGIPKEQLSSIFNPFQQANNHNKTGTGIGLSFARELVRLHQGDIIVKSNETGGGTTFVVSLMQGEGHFMEEEKIRKTSNFPHNEVIVDHSSEINYETTEAENTLETSHEHNLLIIEDSNDLRSFLQGKFSHFFHVLEAENAKKGIDMAFEHIPDIIICDVLLPDIDGFKVVNQLKSDIKTSHIPIILLTAITEIEEQIKGVQAGADIYVTKPFNVKYLHENIKMLIKNRDVMKDYYRSDLSVINANPATNRLDKKFLNDFNLYLEHNISNSALNVEDICKAVAMSRVQLYRKVKSLIGYSVNDYIQNLRLEKAKKMLLENELPVSEIAYIVGFSSPNYFSTAFKAKYDIVPSEYRHQKLKTNSELKTGLYPDKNYSVK